jgi:arginine repressor
LLSCKPPYKLDEKIRAVIEIIKKKPNLMQKEIIQILHEEYKISNVTQACMSRMLKKIHEMHGHCKIIRQAVE